MTHFRFIPLAVSLTAVIALTACNTAPTMMPMGVDADRKLTHWGCGGNLGLVYTVSPRLTRYSRGLSEPREILMRFSLYQRM